MGSDLGCQSQQHQRDQNDKVLGVKVSGRRQDFSIARPHYASHHSLFGLPNIGLEFSEKEDRENKFINFVHNSLSGVNELDIIFTVLPRDYTDLDLPQALFSAKTLTEFEDLISNLPFLRILYLNTTNGDRLKRVKVSSQRLVKLKLITSLEAIVIDAPNLHTFKYAASTTPSVVSVYPSRLVKATYQLYTPIAGMNASFFLKLREIVEYFKQVERFTLRLSIGHFSFLRLHFDHIFIPSFLHFLVSLI
ncbi:unnamed protein product [Dovyalis caffra]|uniref:Maturase K n=1 Tax=Dovyalis caffra TaxID=77055 RepID=A0AAV1RIC4_9ROSI|nr:unnamed protein product [Dovyalis caffra]